MGHLLFKQKLFSSSFPAFRSFQLSLSFGEAPVVDDLDVMLKGAKLARPGLLGLPLPKVLLSELLADVKPQCGLGGHVVPAESSTMRQPRVNIVDDGVG